MRLKQSFLGAVGHAAQSCPLPKHIMVMPKSIQYPMHNTGESMENIKVDSSYGIGHSNVDDNNESVEELMENLEVGSLYEIDHSKLPPKCPAMLKSLRAVMVSAKTRLNVKVRYPSSESLQAYFGKVDCEALNYPKFDEMFVMEPKLAVEVLGRQIEPEEFAQHKHPKSFWLHDYSEIEELHLPASNSGVGTAPNSMVDYGGCLSMLQKCGINGWGAKRIISYLPADKELDDPEGMSNLSHGDCKQSVQEAESHETKVEEVRDCKQSLQEEESHETKVEEVRECKQSLQEEEGHGIKVKGVIQYSRKRKRGRPVGSLTKKSKQCHKRKSVKLKPKVEGDREGERVERCFKQKSAKLRAKVEGDKEGGRAERCFKQSSPELKQPKVEANQEAERAERYLKRKCPKLEPEVDGNKEGEHVEKCYRRKFPKLMLKVEGGKERIDRWSVTRYEAASKQLVEVLKANKAVCGNPICRAKLRTETRKRIGDTGLLDHLLKHLAGQVVPFGGHERFRRRVNDDGKMVYWLESADLANIRKEAGVKDPYWTPSPGWKPGDRIIPHSCICCQQVTVLKNELSGLRRHTTELKIKDDTDQATTVHLLETAASSGRFNSKKDAYELLVKEKSVLEEQLLKVSKALMELENDVEMLSCEEAKQTSLVLYNSKSLPAEEMNEMNRTSTEDLAGETSGELSESDGEEVERDSQANRRSMLIRLKPCRRSENISSVTCAAVDHPGEDIMTLTPASASPHSTTTS